MGHRGFRGMVSTIFPPPMCGGAAGIGVCSGVGVLVGLGFPSCGIMAGQVPSLVVMVQGMGLSQALGFSGLTCFVWRVFGVFKFDFNKPDPFFKPYPL